MRGGGHEIDGKYSAEKSPPGIPEKEPNLPCGGGAVIEWDWAGNQCGLGEGQSRWRCRGGGGALAKSGGLATAGTTYC